MRQILSVLMAVLLGLSLAACSQAAEASQESSLQAVPNGLTAGA